MSFGTMYVSNSGLRAQQRGIDVVANNIANVNTTGFKASRVHFQEILTRTISPAQAAQAGAGTVNAKQVGLGTVSAAIEKDFRQGAILQTGMQTEIAMEGEGLFVLQGTGVGQPALVYTRDGAFHADAESATNLIRFANAEGNLLLGANGVRSPLTGLMSLPSSGLGLTPEVIEIDVGVGLPAEATSTIEFKRNLFSLAPLAMDAVTLETETLGVDNTFRIEFQRAAGGTRELFFFRATETAESAPSLAFAPVTDTGGGAIDGQAVEGIVEFDSQGQVIGWYSAAADADGNDLLVPAEIAALSPWTETTTTAVAGEAHGTADGATVPAPFALGRRLLDAGSVVIQSNATVLTDGTDYTVDLTSGQVTPLTVWPAGAVTADYTYATPFFTVGQGPVAVAAEAHGAADGATVPQRFGVNQPPIQAGTLVVNATIAAAAVVEGTDYTVDLLTGIVTPLTVWDAGAVTVDYTRDDTRERIEFDSRGAPPGTVAFRSVQSGESASGEIRDVEDVVQGLAVEVYDDRGDAHSLSVRFERLSRNRWLYETVPTLRETLDSSVVIDTAFDGGVSAATVTLDSTGAIAADPIFDGMYRVTVEVDEGAGFVEWTQVESAGNFISTGAGSRSYKVIGGATSAPQIAFSRDVAASAAGFAVRVTRTLAAPSGTGTLEFDSTGVLSSAPVVQATTIPLTLATTVAPTLDFTDLFQTASATTVAALQDGFTDGDFIDYEFDDTGRIFGSYTNGKTQGLGRVLIARFTNNSGLEAMGTNVFKTGANTGAATYGFTGEEGRGAVRPRALEGSNVDLSVQLVDLILYQRIYQFNSKVITTVDTMIQEAIQMKR